MQQSEVISLIQQELPKLIAQEPLVRDFILRTVSEYYAGKQETESKFDRVLAELRDREEQACKWDEQAHKWDEQNLKWDENGQRIDAILAGFERDREEQARKWDEQTHKWEEQQRQNQALLEEIRQINRKYDSTIGTLGSRWGLYSEASFRNALKGILGESFGVEVLNLTLYDSKKL